MKQQLYKLTILALTATITLGCMPQEKPSVEAPIADRQDNFKPVISSELTLSELSSSGGLSKLSLKGTKEYKENEAISFTVNTMGKSGYLYIIYLDNKGETQFLYPNEKTPLTELSGEYTFPKDFGNITINASKDCNGCTEDKTTIFAILTKKPVSDIKSISKGHLLTFAGIKSSSAPKGLNMSLGGGSATSHSNMNIGQIEFTVK
jgi:hypothetical protein